MSQIASAPSQPRSAPDLEQICRRIRRATVEMIATAGKGHPGSSLSCVEMLVSLYYRSMNWNPDLLDDDSRDRFVLSKGHAAPTLYAILIDRGVLPRSDSSRLRLIGSPLQGHPDPRFTPGVEFATGSLGQGLSAAVGMALGLRRRGSGARVYALVGDGECQEGQVWEAANFAAAQGLDNLCVLVDDNRLQHDAATADLVGTPDLERRWSAFGWSVETVDGHDLVAIDGAVAQPTDGRPRAVVGSTVKGRGVDFMEGVIAWHSVSDVSLMSQALTQVTHP